MGSFKAGVVFFQYHFLTGVIFSFSKSEVVFKSGVAFERIQYSLLCLYLLSLRIVGGTVKSMTALFYDCALIFSTPIASTLSTAALSPLKLLWGTLYCHY